LCIEALCISRVSQNYTYTTPFNDCNRRKVACSNVHTCACDVLTHTCIHTMLSQGPCSQSLPPPPPPTQQLTPLLTRPVRMAPSVSKRKKARTRSDVAFPTSVSTYLHFSNLYPATLYLKECMHDPWWYARQGSMHDS